MNSGIRHIYSILLAIVFASICALPVLGLILISHDATTRSLAENRDLASLPALPESRTEMMAWPAGLGDFVSDHFGGRRTFVKAYNFLHVKMGSSPLKRVVVGKNGWFYLNQTGLTEANRGALPLGQARLDMLRESFTARNDYLHSLGKRFVVLPAPDKNSVYPEYLPDSVKHIGPSRYQQFQQSVANDGFLSAAVMESLQDARSRGEWVYYQTDSHWNCRGAWFAYQALMQALRDDGYTGGKILQELDFHFEQPATAYSGDLVKNLLNLGGLIPEPHAYTCRPETASEISATRPADGTVFDYVYSAPPGKEHRRYSHRETRDGSRVLVYRDSYANALLPFLIETFDEVIYAAPPVQMGFDPADVKQYDPDLVIYEFVERALHYRPDNSMLESELQAINKDPHDPGN